MIGPLSDLNRLIRENRVNDYRSPNLALGMRPVAFGSGSSQWLWPEQLPHALNPFGTIQGGYLALFVDELLSTAVGSVLEEGEWAVTAETKISYLRGLQPQPLEGTGRVLRRSRALAFLEARVTTVGSDPAVLATSTWAISRMPPAI